MFIIKLLNFLKGYVCITAESIFLERFINICIRRNLYLWDIKKQGDRKMRAKISIANFRKIRPVAYKTRSRVRIYKRRGIPFIVHKYRKRKMFLLGLVLFCVMMWYFSSFLMGIEVTGDLDAVPKAKVIQSLSEFGVTLGTPLGSIDTTLLQNQLMSNIPECSWVGINKSGSKIYVDVKERKPIPKIIEKHIPCNMVAKKDGVIAKLEVKSGQPVVKLNDIVVKGQLLVSGAVDSEVDGVRYIHSHGSVYARTWYEKSKEYPLEYQERTNTGKTETKNSLKFLNFYINFYLNTRIPYSFYDKIESEHEYKLPGNFFPSFFISSETYQEQTVEDKIRTVEETFQLGTEELKILLELEIPESTEIKSIEPKYTQLENGNINVTVIYECLEDIAEQTLLQQEP